MRANSALPASVLRVWADPAGNHEEGGSEGDFEHGEVLSLGGLTRIRLHLAIYFLLHRGSLPENTASWQEPKRQTLSLPCGEQKRQNPAREVLGSHR